MGCGAGCSKRDRSGRWAAPADGGAKVIIEARGGGGGTHRPHGDNVRRSARAVNTPGRESRARDPRKAGPMGPSAPGHRFSLPAKSEANGLTVSFMAVQNNLSSRLRGLPSGAKRRKARSGADGPHARKARRPHRKRTECTLRMRPPKLDAAGGPSPPAHPWRVGGRFVLDEAGAGARRAAEGLQPERGHAGVDAPGPGPQRRANGAA